MIKHPFEPVFDGKSKILILGSFPSVKSREELFYYGNPQNRFWKVLAAVFGEDAPKTVKEKKRFLLDNRIALWDVVSSCEIEGSADSSIKNVRANDLSVIFDKADIKQVFVNGKTAERYYNKFLRKNTGKDAVCLPSTSPANAKKSFEELCREWKIIVEI